MKLNRRKYVARALVDYFIYSQMGYHPTKEQIEKELERRRSKIRQAELSNSRLKKLLEQSSQISCVESEVSCCSDLISNNEDIITINIPIVERLEGALKGDPLYRDSFLRTQRAIRRILNLAKMEDSSDLKLKNWPFFLVSFLCIKFKY